MSKRKFSYDKSIEELESILEQINTGSITVDDLQVRVTRARDLIKSCKEKLRSTEEDLNSILDNS